MIGKGGERSFQIITMKNLTKSILAILLLALLLTSCCDLCDGKVNGIVIRRCLYVHQSFSEKRELKKLIRQTLNKDEKALVKLNNFWCGGAAGCYDLGFVITQIIYRIGEEDFIKMVNKLDCKEVVELEWYIRLGLAYGDHDKDGILDDRKIENEFPNFYRLLTERERK